MIGKIPKIKKHVPRTQAGFTLIETLIAVLILASSIAGPLSIASRALNTSVVAKDQITAFYLAGDAVEYVRFIRDTNRLLGADWLLGTGGTGAGTDLTPCVAATGCYVDTTGNTYVDANGNTPSVPVACDVSAGCLLMNYDSTNSRFTYANVSASAPIVARSLFTRQIVLTDVVPVSANEKQLIVTVSWSDLGGTTRSVTVKENIFAWQ